MHIKEVVMEGFKSYAVRTVVGPFDEQFNAITGKNGTGKSNILDALCFVLGITQLSKVRVHSLAELVFKQGQTGITKACVGVLLDNRDKTRSPLGYEASDQVTVEREVVIGGRNKYRINGKNVTQQQIASLFHSVQLNVNNPHFLIMQGTITRVINMKPPEVVGLLEEAAGTKMYENRKQEALRTLEKKQARTTEIDQVISGDILPAMNKLRQEKAAFVSWSDSNAQVLKLDRFCIAAEYYRTREVALGQGREAELLSQRETLKQRQQVLEGERKTQDERLAFLKDKNALSGELKKLREQLRTATAGASEAKTELDSRQRKLEQLRRRLTELGSKRAVLDAEKEERRGDVEEAEEAVAASSRELEAVVEHLRAGEVASAGGAGGGGDASLQLDYRNLQEEHRTTNTQLNKLLVETNNLKREIANRERWARERQEQEKEEERKLGETTRELAEVETKIRGSSFDENEYRRLCAEERELEREVETKSGHFNSLQRQLDGRFSVPADERALRSCGAGAVHGLVAQLCRVPPEHGEFLTALDVAAGARLLHLVVDTKQTVATLFSRDLLKKKTTVLPLNDLHYKTLTRDQVRRAAEVAQQSGGRAKPAIDLVEFSPEHRPALEFVFGNVFVCDSYDLARRICSSLGARCITSKGDVLDPGGSATGGAVPRNCDGLRQISEYYAAKKELDAAKTRTQTLAGRMSQLKTEKDRMEPLIRRRDKLQVLRDQLLASRAQNSADAQQQQQPGTPAEARLGKLESEISVKRARTGELAEALAATQEKISQAAKTPATEADRNRQRRELNSRKERVTGEISRKQQELEKQKKALMTAEDTLNVLKENIAGYEGERHAAQEALQSATELRKAREATLAEVAQLHAAKEREELDKNKEMEAIAEQIDQMKGERSSLETQVEKIDSKLEVIRRDAETAKQTVAKIEKDNSWLQHAAILQEVASLKEGGPSGPAVSVEEIFCSVSDRELGRKRADLEKLRETVSDLATRINKKAVTMCERGETELADLQNKRAALEKEKTTIEELISDLDEQKGKTLMNTWHLVNNYLGHIFRALLPNVDARLEPPHGLSAQDGLELRVAFGGKWKDSLTELSGGQKSLLALSLILALLKYKPAPFYILDEVDAALDVSHTKNIGHMIKTVFPDSQFIIVSLKEGMFQNANVLFSTRFQDGTSMVARSALAPTAQTEHTEDKNARKRARVEITRE